MGSVLRKNLIWFLIFSVSNFILLMTPVLAYVPSDPLYPLQGYLQQINIEPAWDIARGAGVVVAVLDSGVDINHPDLKFNIWINPREIAGNGIDNDRNGYIDDIHGWDFITNTPDPSPKLEPGYNVDGVNHGTAIAGLIGAVANNSQGITGVSFNSKIMPLRVLNSQGEGSVEILIKAIRYAVNNGADIINLSLVGYEYSAALEEILSWAHDKGVLVVAAAGNTTNEIDGFDLDTMPAYPACYGDRDQNPWVVAVTSVDYRNQKSFFANYGRNCVDLAAPGENILSLSFYHPTNEDFNNYYQANWRGTSFATALVSGVAALIKSKDQSLKPSQIFSALVLGAQNIDQQNIAYEGRLGFGLLDAGQSLNINLSSGAGYLVKLAYDPAVYYVDNQNRRHLFVNEPTFWSWYSGGWQEQKIKIIEQAEFDNLAVGHNVTVRPGNLIKFKNSDRIFAVTPNAILCELEPAAGSNFYGSDWQKRILLIQNGFEINYAKNQYCRLTVNDRYPDGALIQYVNSEDIYYLQNGQKRLITNNDAFNANNFKKEKVITDVPTSVSYDSGRPITSLDRNIFLYNL